MEWGKRRASPDLNNEQGICQNYVIPGGEKETQILQNSFLHILA